MDCEITAYSTDEYNVKIIFASGNYDSNQHFSIKRQHLTVLGEMLIKLGNELKSKE